MKSTGILAIIKKRQNLFILLGMILVCSLISDRFFTVNNGLNIARQISIVTILAFGETLLIISGGIDLSVGAVAGMAGVLGCEVFIATQSIPLAVLVGILMGAIPGALNGFVVTKFGAPPFIVTLAMQTVASGAIFLHTDGQNVYKIGQFNLLGQGSVGFVPIPIIIMLITGAIIYVILERMKFGRYLYAIGGNESAAIGSGIQVNKVKFITYVISGALAGLAGIVLMSRLNAGLPAAGTGYETDALMATIIGGTSFTGGIGTAVGTLIGSFIMGILNNIFNLTGVQAYVQQILKGVLIVVAVVLDLYTKRKKKRVKIYTEHPEPGVDGTSHLDIPQNRSI